MDVMISFIVKTWLKILFVFTPFLVLSIFLGITRDYDAIRRRAFAMRTIIAMTVICLVVYFFGSVIFSLFGITLDAFRIGAGALLFLSAINLVQGNEPVTPSGDEDLAVVPLAMPIIVGPAVMGVLFVIGADAVSVEERMAGAVAVGLAVASLSGLLLVATTIEKLVGKSQLAILSKITGLILAALSAQMIVTGIKNFLAGG
ncbi:MAG: MarC family protein [Kiritimatiellae bacterium]|nr:MarC family protein [Kiritimatiellia bacterium]